MFNFVDYVSLLDVITAKSYVSLKTKIIVSQLFVKNLKHILTQKILFIQY